LILFGHVEELAVWADNETDEDLLGYDFVVDPLVVALTESRLLPVTVGLLGDWGSGKSSVLKIVRSELEALTGGTDTGETGGRYVCVEFSPWRYEDYDDVKVALMSAVLDRLQAEVSGKAAEEVSRLRRFARGLRRGSRWFGRAALTSAPATAAALAAAIDPAMAATSTGLVTSATGAVAGEARRLLEDPAESGNAASGSDPVLEVAAFRTQFAELVDGLDNVAAVVVLIDDLDRCLPESVVDTFEAIRLFLNTAKTAFVVAANQQVVESAVDSRYPALRRLDGSGIGADYLEKMLQIKVGIPPLSVAEAETYINLLLAELRLPGDLFAAVRAHVAARRAADGFAVAFNLGVAEQVLGTQGGAGTPAVLVRDLEWAAQIGPVLASGLRGNPRQIKRFLNNLMLRSRSAARRGITLDLGVLAKLMVLEDQHFADFRRLFDWQVEAAGPIPQLAAAEALGRAEPPAEPGDRADAGRRGARRQPGREASGATDDGAGRAGEGAAATPPVASNVVEWAARPHVQAWLALAPPLGSVDLRPDFTYSREKLSLGVVASRLAPGLQELLIRVQSDVPTVRRTAIDAIGELGPDERGQVLEALLHTLGRLPGGPAFAAALELAGRVPDTVAEVCDALMRVPVNAVPVAQAQRAVLQLPAEHPSTIALLARWRSGGVPALERVVRIAIETRAARGRG